MIGDPQKCHSAWGRGGPRISFLIGILIFLSLAHTKLQNPTCPLSGRKVRDSEREKRERKIMPSTMATMFMPAAQGQRMHSARTNNSGDKHASNFIHLMSSFGLPLSPIDGDVIYG